MQSLRPLQVERGCYPAPGRIRSGTLPNGPVGVAPRRHVRDSLRCTTTTVKHTRNIKNHINCLWIFKPKAFLSLALYHSMEPSNVRDILPASPPGTAPQVLADPSTTWPDQGAGAGPCCHTFLLPRLSRRDATDTATCHTFIPPSLTLLNPADNHMTTARINHCLPRGFRTPLAPGTPRHPCPLPRHSAQTHRSTAAHQKFFSISSASHSVRLPCPQLSDPLATETAATSLPTRRAFRAD